MTAFDYSLIADLYDSFCRFEADLGFFRRSLQGGPSPVLELMSGTGRVSIALIEDGIDLVCIDLSLPMLEVLQAKLSARGLRARLVCCDVRQLPFRSRFPAAIWPFHGISELAERRHRRQALRELRQALVDEAGLIVTLHNPAIRRHTIDGEWQHHGTFEHVSGPGSVSLTSRLEVDSKDGSIVGVQRVEEISETGEVVASREFPLRFALPSRSEMESDLREAGFVIDELYGDYDATRFDAQASPHLIWRTRAGASAAASGCRSKIRPATGTRRRADRERKR